MILCINCPKRFLKSYYDSERLLRDGSIAIEHNKMKKWYYYCDVTNVVVDDRSFGCAYYPDKDYVDGYTLDQEEPKLK
ncbi:MAG: hypothetical protein WC783_03960 [Candidatus Paceibacterota bacterium]|jgi:hypothetical protein